MQREWSCSGTPQRRRSSSLPQRSPQTRFQKPSSRWSPGKREASRGRGLASSLVDTFRLTRDPSEKDVARLVLLGIPAKNALNRLLESEETGMKSLVTYVASESGLSARDAGRRAERLSVTFERWARLKERRRLEQRVLELRGHMVSAILGPVMAC